MKICEPACYAAFSCIADACPDTCCRGWEVVIDEDTRRTYESWNTDLGRMICSHLRQDEDGDTCMESINGRCSMLMDNGLCIIQKEMGAAALSRVCDRYPRFFHEFGALTERGISLSCPEACRLILDTPFSLVETTTNDPPSLNDIDPECYFAFRRGRALAFRIAEAPGISLHGRMALLLRFAAELESENPDTVLQRWNNPDHWCTTLDTLKPRRRANFLTLRDVFLQMEPLTDRWPAMLRQLHHCPPIPDETILLRVLQYFLYKYFLQAAYDGKLLKKVQLAAAALLMLGSIYATFQPKDRTEEVDLIHLFSRELEHSEPNLACFYRWAGKRRQTLLNALLLG